MGGSLRDGMGVSPAWFQDKSTPILKNRGRENSLKGPFQPRTRVNSWNALAPSLSTTMTFTG